MQGAQRHVTTAIVAVAAGLGIAACGSGGNTTTTTSHTASPASTTQTSTTASAGGSAAFAARRAKLEACLKAHGVTLPSRPAGGGGGYGGGAPGGYGGGAPGGYGGGAPGTGTGTTARRFRPGGGGFFGAGGSNSKFAKAFKACGADFGGLGAGRFGGTGRGARFSKTTLNAFVACVKQHGYTLPKPNTTGKGPVFPKSIESNKQFQAASKSCASLLRPSFGGGAAGPGGAPAGSAPPTSTNSST